LAQKYTLYAEKQQKLLLYQEAQQYNRLKTHYCVMSVFNAYPMSSHCLDLWIKLLIQSKNQIQTTGKLSNQWL